MLYNCEKIAGVYSITSPSGKRYIGSSRNIYARWDRHQQDLRYGTHHSPQLLRAYEKYGKDALQFHILLVCADNMTLEYEQLLLDGLKPEYNTSVTANGVKHTAETKSKISAAVTLAWADPAKRAKQAARYKGIAPKVNSAVFKTEEHRAKLRDVHRARCRTVEAFGLLWSLKELAEHFNVHYGMVKDRVRAGWSAEDAVSTPKRKGGL